MVDSSYKDDKSQNIYEAGFNRGFKQGYKAGQEVININDCITFLSLSDDPTDRFFAVSHDLCSQTIIHLLISDKDHSVRSKALERASFSAETFVELLKSDDELSSEIEDYFEKANYYCKKGLYQEAAAFLMEKSCVSLNSSTRHSLAKNPSLEAKVLFPIRFWSWIRGDKDIAKIVSNHFNFDATKYAKYLINKSSDRSLFLDYRIETYRDPFYPEPIIMSPENIFVCLDVSIDKYISEPQKLKDISKEFYSELEDCDIFDEEMFHATYTRDKLTMFSNYDYSEVMFPIVSTINKKLNDEEKVGADVKKMTEHWREFFCVKGCNPSAHDGRIINSKDKIC